jgi:hypothetical protein
MNTKVFNHLRELVKQVNDEDLREKLVLAASDAEYYVQGFLVRVICESEMAKVPQEQTGQQAFDNLVENYPSLFPTIVPRLASALHQKKQITMDQSVAATCHDLRGPEESDEEYFERIRQTLFGSSA